MSDRCPRLPKEKPAEHQRLLEWLAIQPDARPAPPTKLAEKWDWATRAQTYDAASEVSLIGADQRMRDMALEVELRQLQIILDGSRDKTIRMSPRDLAAWHTMTDALIERAKGRGQERGVVDLSSVLSEEQLLQLKKMKQDAKIAG